MTINGVSADHIRRILVIKLRAVGDVVLSTIVLKNLRAQFHDAHITFLTEAGGAGVLDGNPFIDTLLVYRRHEMSSLALIRAVRSGKFDLILDLFGNPRTALLTFASGAPGRVGYRFRGRTYAYNNIVAPRGGTVHNTQFNLDALDALGIPIVDRHLHIVPGEDDREFGRRFMEESFRPGRPIVALNAGGGWACKRWPLDQFARMGDQLVQKAHASVLLVWGPGEERDVETIRNVMKEKAVAAPPTTLLQLASILSCCSLMVSNDSGPMHIGAAMGTPVLGIFGPTLPNLQGPYGEDNRTIRTEGLPCLGCNLTVCPIQNQCMRNLGVGMVYALAEQMLKVGRAGDPSRIPAIGHQE